METFCGKQAQRNRQNMPDTQANSCDIEINVPQFEISNQYMVRYAARGNALNRRHVRGGSSRSSNRIGFAGSTSMLRKSGWAGLIRQLKSTWVAAEGTINRQDSPDWSHSVPSSCVDAGWGHESQFNGIASDLYSMRRTESGTSART